MARQRLDVMLVNRGLFASREGARAAVLAGRVRVNGVVATKPGQQIDEDVVLEAAQGPQFVSRGGVKLAGALDKFGIDVTGLRAVDIGASTGGFTDCLLQRGAASVSAVDVGYGQLAWSLRTDTRVSVFERTNIRSVDGFTLGAPFDIAVVDVSFIGLLVVLPHVMGLLADNGIVLALVKPQFEAGKGRVGKKGVVRDEVIHREVLAKIAAGFCDAGLKVRGISVSPITGSKGNIEFWLWAEQREGGVSDIDIEAVVREAHKTFGV